MNNKWVLPLALLLTVVLGVTARAYINPRFTPKDLVKDSELILVLEFKSPDAKGKAIATVKKVLKGDSKDKEVTFDLLAMPVPMQAQGKAIIDTIAEGEHEALLFVGKFQAEGTGLEGAGDKVAGLLHIGGKWSIMELADNKTWEMEKIDEKMLGTFSGGTDMLLRCVTYVVADPNADVPVAEKVDWGEKIRIGKTNRKINTAAAVDLAGDGKLAAFLASEAGDQVFRWNEKTMEHVTAKLALQSKSVAFAWGDFNGDGRLDLASWDGKQLRIHQQKADGTFTPVDVKAGDAFKDGCVSLSILDIGRSGRPGLLVGTKAAPVILTLKEDGAAEGKSLVAGDFPGKDLGEAGPCVVCDFDGDSLPDVVQICSRGGLFYKGLAPGSFAPPVKNKVGFGQGRHGVCLGDYDHDGLPDILVVSAEAVPCLYQNLGGGKFANVLPRSGSFEYISKPGGIYCQTIDINNDGRQDIFVAYDAGPAPQVFFNRGFRCFGLARRLETQLQESLPQASEGQQAGCVADFTGHNAMDMFIVLGNGELWLVPRQVDDPALAVVAAVSARSACAGPVVVTAFDQNKRPLGAWTVSAGEPGAFFGVAETGTLTLKWRWPGGGVQEKQVVVADKAVRVVLDKAN
ncbi:MAG: FG-GAP repeat domain-containing protein [Tepidisphaerales bacterium]